MKHYTITLNEEQMLLVSHCIEDIHRFLCGDTELYFATSVLDGRKEVRARLREITPNGGEGYDWAGNGCKNPRQKKMIAGTYYLYREMLHRYNEANKRENVYSSPTLRCKDSGEFVEISWEE